MENSDPSTPEASELEPCQICGRTFRLDALERHQRICEKTAAKKRKVFDSSKQRSTAADGSSTTNTVTKNSNTTTTKPRKFQRQVEKPKKKSNWREKHEELIRTIRASRGVDTKDSNNAEPVKSHIPSDYVQCPACERRFNERAAERHIPWCQKKKAQTPKTPNTDDEAKEKLKARTKYKAPQPGKIRKPKTAVHTSSSEKLPKPREQAPYSSPPSLVEVRNEKNNNQNTFTAKEIHKPLRKREKVNINRGKHSQSHNDGDLRAHHIIKFKERFPNRANRRGIDLEESFSSEQLRELLSSSRITETKGPKTVPGVRCMGGYQNNYSNNRSSNDNLVSRSSTSDSNLSTSGSSSSSSHSWNRRLLDDSTLPEVSSSELPGSWIGKYCWSGDLDASVSSSGSSSNGSLPPLSRESPTETLPLASYCHQCNSKFPLIGAKYCCECGAKRRTVAQGNAVQTV